MNASLEVRLTGILLWVLWVASGVALLVAIFAFTRVAPPKRLPLTLEQRQVAIARCKDADLLFEELTESSAIVEIRCVVPGTTRYYRP